MCSLSNDVQYYKGCEVLASSVLARMCSLSKVYLQCYRRCAVSPVLLLLLMFLANTAHSLYRVNILTEGASSRVPYPVIDSESNTSKQ